MSERTKDYMILFEKDVDQFLHNNNNLNYYDLDKETKRNCDVSSTYFSSFYNAYSTSTLDSDRLFVKRVHDMYHCSGERLSKLMADAGYPKRLCEMARHYHCPHC